VSVFNDDKNSPKRGFCFYSVRRQLVACESLVGLITDVKQYRSTNYLYNEIENQTREKNRRLWKKTTCEIDSVQINYAKNNVSFQKLMKFSAEKELVVAC